MQRTATGLFGELRVRPWQSRPMVSLEKGRAADSPTELPGWRPGWRGHRPADTTERFTLYRCVQVEATIE